eukprot:359412-Chlamydomonas_euryale.AAC.9
MQSIACRLTCGAHYRVCKSREADLGRGFPVPPSNKEGTHSHTSKIFVRSSTIITFVLVTFTAAQAVSSTDTRYACCRLRISRAPPLVDGAAASLLAASGGRSPLSCGMLCAGSGSRRGQSSGSATSRAKDVGSGARRWLPAAPHRSATNARARVLATVLPDALSPTGRSPYRRRQQQQPAPVPQSTLRIFLDSADMKEWSQWHNMGLFQ